MMKKYAVLSFVTESLENGSDNGLYEFVLCGHLLENDMAIGIINELLFYHGTGFIREKVVSKAEIGYNTSRLFFGSTVAYNDFFLDFYSYDNYKKGMGKCTRYIVTLVKGDGE